MLGGHHALWRIAQMDSYSNASSRIGTQLRSLFWSTGMGRWFFGSVARF
jgi:hypothetical protein